MTKAQYFDILEEAQLDGDISTVVSQGIEKTILKCFCTKKKIGDKTIIELCDEHEDDGFQK